MTEDRDIDVQEVDSIERGEATRPWTLDETTVYELDAIEGLHRRIDTVFVPWGAQEPVDTVEVLFTVDTKVLTRRDRTLSDVVGDVSTIVETDPRLDEYVVFDQIEPSAVAAKIDDSRTRVQVRWGVTSDE